jgi:hypothetical protein
MWSARIPTFSSMTSAPPIVRRLCRVPADVMTSPPRSDSRWSFNLWQQDSPSRSNVHGNRARLSIYSHFCILTNRWLFEIHFGHPRSPSIRLSSRSCPDESAQCCRSDTIPVTPIWVTPGLVSRRRRGGSHQDPRHWPFDSQWALSNAFTSSFEENQSSCSSAASNQLVRLTDRELNATLHVN